MDKQRLYDLISMDSPEAILAEVATIIRMLFPDADLQQLTAAFRRTADLYQGLFPGYRACNTRYHDFQHITETFLAMARLVHGAVVGGQTLNRHQMFLGLTAALLHDVGYIQETADNQGTGGKHTIIHVRRGMDFVERHGLSFGLSGDEIKACQIMIYCTDLTADFDSIIYPSREVEMIGKMLASADLVSQMADRTHLEKLLYLYQEFREGMVSGYDSAEDLLRKTVGFYDLVEDRLINKLDRVDRYMIFHFKERWQIDIDLYRTAIENEKNYLYRIISKEDSELLDQLRRRGIVENSRKT